MRPLPIKLLTNAQHRRSKSSNEVKEIYHRVFSPAARAESALLQTSLVMCIKTSRSDGGQDMWQLRSIRPSVSQQRWTAKWRITTELYKASSSHDVLT